MTIDQLDKKYEQMKVKYNKERDEDIDRFYEELYAKEIKENYRILMPLFDTLLEEIIKLERNHKAIDIKYFEGTSWCSPYIKLNRDTYFYESHVLYRVLKSFKIKEGFYHENITIKEAIWKFSELFDEELSARVGINVNKFRKESFLMDKESRNLLTKNKQNKNTFKIKDDCTLQSLILFMTFMLFVCIISQK